MPTLKETKGFKIDLAKSLNDAETALAGAKVERTAAEQDLEVKAINYSISKVRASHPAMAHLTHNPAHRINLLEAAKTFVAAEELVSLRASKLIKLTNSLDIIKRDLKRHKR